MMRGGILPFLEGNGVADAQHPEGICTMGVLWDLWDHSLFQGGTPSLE